MGRGMIVLIDNYDSFTYNLYQYVRMLGREVVVLRNDAFELDEVAALCPELIIISPGPGGPESTGKCMALLDRFHACIPILGICLGMRTISRFFGGRVVKAQAPVHGKVREVLHDGTGLFRSLPSPLRVTRYHSLAVEAESMPSVLKVTAWSPEREIMGIAHESYPVFGVQFHPEAYLTEGGLKLLKNALELACSARR